MNIIQTTLEDIQKWWEKIVTKINILENLLFKKKVLQPNQCLFHSNFNTLMKYLKAIPKD